MRRLALAVALLLTACAGQPPAILRPTPTPEAGVLDVTALLDLSGSRLPRGDAQRNALQLWTDLDRSRGGGPVRVRLKVVDVAGSDAKLIVEMRRAAEEDRADALIVGVPVSFLTPTFDEAVRAARLPVLLTLPAADPVARTGSGRWTFALAPTPEQIARAAVVPGPRTAIVVVDGRPLDGETTALIAEHARRSSDDPAIVRIGRDDPAALVRFLATETRVHLAGAPREWIGLASSLRANAQGPTYVLSWLCDAGDLGELRELDPAWPAPAALGSATTTGARRDVIRAYTDRHGPPSAVALAAYDAMTDLALAAERVGPDDRERLREQLELVAFAGVASTYAFSVTRHAGYAGDDIAMYRWSGGAVLPDTRR